MLYFFDVMGHNLTAHGDCQSLSFVVRRLERKAVIGGDRGVPIGPPKTPGRDATNPEKQNDYNFLIKHKGLGKYGAEQLAAYTTLELKDVNGLFEKDLKVAIEAARTEFTSTAFDAYPVSCQAALTDIAFNCGSFATFNKTLVPAIKGQGPFAGKPWNDRCKAAAANSRRGQVSAARNAAIFQWFTDGANGLP